MGKIREIIEHKKYEILEKEKQKGIQRYLVENEVKETEKVGKYGIHHLSKATIPSKKIKLIRVGFPKISDTEIIRHLIEEETRKILKRDKIGKGASKLEYLQLRFPIKAIVGEYYDCYRIDISKCFWSIYSRSGIDCRIKLKIQNEKAVEYITIGKGLLTKENSEIVMELEHDKKNRNTVYGLTRSCFANFYYPSSGWTRQFFASKLLNPEFHGFISVFLHVFLNRIEEMAEVVYWNIDGGFIITEDIQKIKEIAEDFGINLKIEKAKKVAVTRLGGYMWDDGMSIHESGHFRYTGTHGQKKIEYRYTVINQEKFIKDWRKLCLKL